MLSAKERQKIRRKIKRLTVDYGAHDTFDDGSCVMEITAYAAGMKTCTDSPRIACEFVTPIMIQVNDKVSSNVRQELKALVPYLIGTRSRTKSMKRAYWLLQTFLLYAADKGFKQKETFTEYPSASTCAKASGFIKNREYDLAFSILPIDTCSILSNLNAGCIAGAASGFVFFIDSLIPKDEKAQMKFVKDFICIVKRSLMIDF